MLFLSSPEPLPTDFALAMRKPFIASLMLLMGIAICKIAISDYWGAVNTTLVVILGFFVVGGQYSVNASSAFIYAAVAATSAIFDVITCIMYFQHSRYSLFDDKATAMVIFAQVTFILSPVGLIISASIAYAIYSDCRDRHLAMIDPPLGQDYGAVGWSDLHGQSHAQRPGIPPAPTPFQGQGQRLGDTPEEAPDSPGLRGQGQRLGDTDDDPTRSRP